MHSNLSRLVVLLAMLVCLPMNGLAALTMPVCDAHGQGTSVQAAADQMHSMPNCDHHDGKHQTGKTPCDKCLSCHVVSAQAIFLLGFAMPEVRAAAKFSVTTAEKPQSLSAPLFRPPITFFA